MGFLPLGALLFEVGLGELIGVVEGLVVGLAYADVDLVSLKKKDFLA